MLKVSKTTTTTTTGQEVDNQFRFDKAIIKSHPGEPQYFACPNDPIGPKWLSSLDSEFCLVSYSFLGDHISKVSCPAVSSTLPHPTCTILLLPCLPACLHACLHACLPLLLVQRFNFDST
ncbi:hypothetical protein T11_14220 [Trichinella zimbabwensis]|uniref:Uncharacterized protein n=1 Tax=Trichinella zimbabwensis TaxID=268475 RepID=A0A0V1H207_9BILA|nr:hypothetical protein T11_14220 [Trichinella zimbabwensis]